MLIKKTSGRRITQVASDSRQPSVQQQLTGKADSLQKLS